MVPGYYSREVIVTLLLMIITGAARTVAVKVYFQLGYDDPLLVAILMLLGHSLAVPIYFAGRYCVLKDEASAVSDDVSKDSQEHFDTVSESEDLESSTLVEQSAHRHRPAPADVPVSRRQSTTDDTDADAGQQRRRSTVRILMSTSWVVQNDFIDDNSESKGGDDDDEKNKTLMKNDTAASSSVAKKTDQADDDDPREKEQEAPPPSTCIASANRGGNRGSLAGLTLKSVEAVQWVHKIPAWAKPLLSSVFNLLDVVFRMLSILYLAASVAEMMIGGLELIFSIFAARLIRKRNIARERWFGAGVMVLGLVLVATSDLVSEESDSDEDASDSFGLGIMFVFLKVIMGVSKDLTQELFMQEAAFPATLLLGLESFYGLVVALPLYFLIGPIAGYDPVESFRGIGESALSIGYTVGLIVVIFLAGMYSILGTAVTSSMTRNMWKNFRGLVVWIAALVIFYASGDDTLGEPWTVPGSIMILSGFAIMMAALYVYYGGIAICT